MANRSFDSGKPLRVLIADDNRPAAQAVAELLALAFPCETRIAIDGFEALQKALAWRPDAMVLDLRMPGHDGVEVARMIREQLADDLPFLIALTGYTPTSPRLAAIDQHFDRVFAKPLDVDQLVAALAGLSAGQELAAPRPATTRFDFAELFTRAVRQVVPVARHLSMTFDYCGAMVIVDAEPISIHCGLHRLLLGAADMLVAGFVLFRADVKLADDGASCTVVIDMAGTGPLQTPAAIDAVLERLLLIEVDAPAGARPGVRSASGICPNTGSPVSFSSDVHEGFLLRTTLRFTQPEEIAAPAHVAGAGAWLIDSDEVPSAWLYRRLQRLGWRVTRFASCAEALSSSSIPGDAAGRTPPALLVVVESATLPPGPAEALRGQLAPSTHCVYATMAGSERLGTLEAPAGYELCVHPFSPADLADFGALASPSAAASRWSDSVAAGLGFVDRPTVLLVDDNEVNRLVGRGLLEALGYEVATANDGLDAIDHCRREPPRIVLMDLDMPVLRGLEATVRLRELQRRGEIAPFSIVAATADATVKARAACELAGMDGYLTKPLRLSELRAELRRVAPPPAFAPR